MLLSSTFSRLPLVRGFDALRYIRPDDIHLTHVLWEASPALEYCVGVLYSFQDFGWVFQSVFLVRRYEVVPCCSADLVPDFSHELLRLAG